MQSAGVEGTRPDQTRPTWSSGFISDAVSVSAESTVSVAVTVWLYGYSTRTSSHTRNSRPFSQSPFSPFTHNENIYICWHKNCINVITFSLAFMTTSAVSVPGNSIAISISVKCNSVVLPTPAGSLHKSRQQYVIWLAGNLRRQKGFN